MPKEAFNVTTAVQSLPLKPGTHKIDFTVSNLLDRSVRTHTWVEILENNEPIGELDWISVVKPDTFDMAPDGTASVEVRIEVPSALPEKWVKEKVSLQLRLIVRNVDEPEKEKGESVFITLHPDSGEVVVKDDGKARLWRTLALVGGGVILLAVLGFAAWATYKHFFPPAPDEPDAAPPAPLQSGEACKDVSDRSCAPGLLCGPTLGVCIPEAPILDGLCDPGGPACPTSSTCRKDGPTLSYCRAVIDVWQECNDSARCSGNLVCGPTLARCVLPQPGVGDYCDPGGPRCPADGTCENVPDGSHRCVARVAEGQRCDAPNTLCNADLQCGPSLRLCIKPRPATDDRCDPRGPVCPSTDSCKQIGADFFCKQLVAEGGTCDPALDTCKAGLVCGRTTRKCVRQSPGTEQRCDPGGPACPNTDACKQVGSDFLCKRLVDEGGVCTLTPDTCNTGLVCGRTTNRCVKQSPGTEQRCDPSGPACPRTDTCTQVGSDYFCKSQVDEGGICNPALDMCKTGLVCGRSTNRCVPRTAATEQRCDPSGPSCPITDVCKQVGSDFYCKRQIAEGGTCSPALDTCKTGLVCGRTTQKCVRLNPLADQRCDPSGPTCPATDACKQIGSDYLCKRLLDEGDTCNLSLDTCKSGLVCGTTSKRCVRQKPGTEQRCDPSGPACPATDTCKQVGSNDYLCKRLIDEGGTCNPSLDTCKAGLLCGAATRRCVKTSPRAGDLCDLQSQATCPSGAVCRVTLQGQQCIVTDTKVLEANTGAPWGSWPANNAMCPAGWYAWGFRQKVEGSQGNGDDSALNSVQLYCAPAVVPAGGYTPAVIESSAGAWGGWSAVAKCPGAGQFLSEYRIKVENNQGSGDDSGGNAVSFKCTSYPGSTQTTDWVNASNDGGWGSWRGGSACPADYHVCGFAAKVEASQGSGDDTSMNDIRIVCCNW